MLSAEGKVVLITGGGRGIGYGIAQAFAEAGARIAITGRTASTLIEAAENLEADYGNEVLWITADGGDEAAVKGVVEKVIDKYGKLDCLVNNAQASKSGVMLADHTKDDFDLAVSTGLYATFFYMREAFPQGPDDKVHRMLFFYGSDRVRNLRASKAVLSMDDGPGQPVEISHHRSFASRIDIHIGHPGVVQNLPGITGCIFQFAVTGHCGNAQKLNIVRSGSQQQGDRVVMPRIAVHYYFFHVIPPVEYLSSRCEDHICRLKSNGRA